MLPHIQPRGGEFDVTQHSTARSQEIVPVKNYYSNILQINVY